ncbi:MAG: diaminopimelate epimerase [Bacteroidota bacterium]
MRFVKMHGAGNDYVFVDSLTDPGDPAELARRISDRHFGVGGDGLVLILPSAAADARMRMFNADGSEAGMCGNAIRCVAKYLFDRGRVGREPVIETGAGLRHLTMQVDEARGIAVGATVDMGEPSFAAGDIPMTGEERQVLGERLSATGQEFEITAVSMGNPHCVIFVPDVDLVPLSVWGPAIEHHEVFPRRTNVEFVTVVDRANLKVRVWERGSGETLACGTGASASLAAAVMRGLTDRRTAIELPGGNLMLEWKPDGHIYLTGPAVEVFTGEWEA